MLQMSRTVSCVLCGIILIFVIHQCMVCRSVTLVVGAIFIIKLGLFFISFFKSIYHDHIYNQGVISITVINMGCYNTTQNMLKHYSTKYVVKGLPCGIWVTYKIASGRDVVTLYKYTVNQCYRLQ